MHHPEGSAKTAKMDKRAANVATHRRTLIVLGAISLGLAPVAVYARLGTVVLLIAALAAQPNFTAVMATIRTLSRGTLVRLGALLTAWAAVTLFWTPEPSIFDLVRVAGVPVMGLLLMAAVRDLPPADTERLARLTALSGLAMLALLALEVWSKGAVLSFVIPDVGPLPPGLTAPIIEASARGAAVLAPLAFVYSRLIYALTRRIVSAALFIVAVVAVCFSTTMDAAWVAVLAGSIAFGVARIAPRFALVGVFTGLAAYAVLAPVISTYVLTLDGISNLGSAPWVGLQTRIGIWHEAARLIAERPIWGHGFDATRVLSRTAGNIPGTPWPALPLHTHNGFLQIWLELGGVGIAITVALLAAAVRALWPMTARPIHLALTLATLTSGAVIALISFGIWQYWWLATWMFAAALLGVALRQPPLTPA